MLLTGSLCNQTKGFYTSSSDVVPILGCPLRGASFFLGTIYRVETLMDTLDLHGNYHNSVQRLVENFVLLNPTPLRIITGNSSRMKEMVFQILDCHEFGYHYENFNNYGSLIVTNKIPFNSI